MFSNGMYYGGFFDMPDNSYPADADYYFNVLLYDIAVRPGDLSLPQLENLDEVWYVDHITDPRPYAMHIWVDHNRWDDRDPPYDYEKVPHAVIEIRPSGISWWNMIDWETDDNWRLDEPDEDDYEPVW